MSYEYSTGRVKIVSLARVADVNGNYTLVPTDIVPLNQTGLSLNDRIGLVPNASVPSTQPGLLTALTPATPYNASLPSFEIHVVGNVVNQQYIAGLSTLTTSNAYARCERRSPLRSSSTSTAIALIAWPTRRTTRR